MNNLETHLGRRNIHNLLQQRQGKVALLPRLPAALVLALLVLFLHEARVHHTSGTCRVMPDTHRGASKEQER